MQCSFCDRNTDHLSGIDAVIDAGWIPTYWDGDTDTGNPVCPDCVSRHLVLDSYSGEFTLRKMTGSFVLPALGPLLAESLTL